MLYLGCIRVDMPFRFRFEGLSLTAGCPRGARLLPGLSRGYLVAILSEPQAIEVCILCQDKKE